MKHANRIVSFIFILLTVVSVFNPYAQATGESTQLIVNEAPVSSEYIRYTENPDAYSNGLVPTPFSFSEVDYEAGYPVLESAAPEASNVLPEVYDSREEGYTTPVKNQGGDGTCAAFAMLGNYETLIKKLTGNETDLSEYHAKHAIAKSFSDAVNPYGYDRSPKSGAHFCFLFEYCMSGLGPQSEADFPYVYGDELELSSNILGVSSELRATQIQLVPGIGDDPTDAQREEWINTIKNLIYEYGSVAISTVTDISYMTDNYTYSYYTGDAQYDTHAILAVGWDDTIAAEKFTVAEKTPSRDGGFIIKNSWGASVSEEGYFYLSYDTVRLGAQDSACITEYTDYDARTEKITSYAEGGQTTAITLQGQDICWFGNMFYLDAGEYVNLDAVNFYVMGKGMPYEIYISPSGSVRTADMQLIASGVTDQVGYYSIPVEQIALGDEERSSYFIAIKLDAEGISYPIPIEYGTYLPNFTAEYIEYTDTDGNMVIAGALSDTLGLLEEQNIGYSYVPVSYYAGKAGIFNETTDFNVVLAAVTSKVQDTSQFEIISAELSQGGSEASYNIFVETTPGVSEVRYSCYILSGGKVYFSEAYSTSSQFAFSLTDTGEYTAVVYADNAENTRVSKRIAFSVT